MLNKFHEAQIIMAFATLLIAMFQYNNAITGREQLPRDVAIASMAFLFGKFTNGFSRFKPSRIGDIRKLEERTIVERDVSRS